jgi:hypothetical protein
MSQTFNCKKCGKTGQHDGSYQGTPEGWYSTQYCCEAHKIEFEQLKNQKNAQSKEEKAAKNSEAEQAKAKAAEAKSQENSSKWNTYAQLGTAAFSAASSTGKEVKETTDYLAKLVFSNESEELANQLSEICSMWGGAEKYMLKDNTVAVKKAAYEKFEFGIMKLEQVGTQSQIEFFKKKQKEMKPKKFFGLF